ncbi:hypothetical protein [Falsarthrobacter nasiphocae]|uniref:Uncharacterized protein n=1 Tax=Falsarthrobacter nasiphocae TaxID=189863 RepID=A0AAE3YDX4_9MICC|nr:hypothetical protein [Falsarthrobacter nasiphocae]MDR6891599.1 hypothetical protein [Falsarthrobacter nasiphocae]
MALPSRRTLNEALFSGRSVTRAVMELADEVSADVVIGDGLRVWSPLLATGRPVIMHLDDLLSDRYSSPEFSAGNDSILGYFGSQIPAALRPLAERVAKLTLGMEAHRARRQEILIARTANVTAMTSEAEAQVLAERSGTGVVALPMAVDARGASVPSKAPANSAVFFGRSSLWPKPSGSAFLAR